MARAYSQDLRDRVIKTALGGVSVRQAAARYRRKRRQGTPARSRRQHARR